MESGIPALERAYEGVFAILLGILAVMFLICLIRAVIGPRVADRIVSVNMLGTMVIVAIAVLAVMLGEGYLADVCMIYAMLSFLAVVIITKVYMGVYLEKKSKKGEKKDGNA